MELALPEVVHFLGKAGQCPFPAALKTIVDRTLEASVRYVAAELGPKGIRVHAISPGPLATRAASGIAEFDALLEKARAQAPARSLVSIDDVGAATAFLAHDAARLITAKRSTSIAVITSWISRWSETTDLHHPPNG